MPQKIRLYELARELGMTNQEVLDLCGALGIGVKSHSSSIVDAQADRARRRAERDGLTRAVQPPDETPAKAGRAQSNGEGPATTASRPVDTSPASGPP